MSTAATMPKRVQRAVLLTAAALILWPAIGSAQDFKVVVNSSVVDTSVSRKTLSKMFLNQHEQWGDGTAVVAIDQSADSDVRAEFSKAVHGRDANAVKNYWNRIIFSGRGKPPVEQATDVDVMKDVKSHIGAIGYVSADTALISGVKTLRITDH